DLPLDDLAILIVLREVALAYKQSGQAGRAVPLYERVLEKMTDKLGRAHPDTLKTMSYLGSAYWAAKQFDRSVPLLEEVLWIRQWTLRLDEQGAIVDKGNLGVNYWDAGRRQEGMATLAQAWAEALAWEKAQKSPRFPQREFAWI